MTVEEQAPAGADRIRHFPECRGEGPYRTRPCRDSDQVVVVCRICGARATMTPADGPARPSRATTTPADDGRAQVVVAGTDAWPRPAVVARPVVARTNLAITRYFCAVHPDVVVSWRGTCTDCAQDRAELARSRRSRRAGPAALQAGGSLR